ncbi:MAG: beta-lactamase family protein [Bacteroidales bacterium]|nr:beta-lactamase family protein [Bacteroidales bacterium]
MKNNHLSSKTIIALSLLGSLINGCCSKNTGITRIDILENALPESVGMSSERLAHIDTVVTQYIGSQWLPGAVCLIARHGKIVYYKSFGWRDIESGDKMEEDDIFRIASMTKALTSTCVMMLYEEGYFLLDDPISKYIPEFKNPMILESVNFSDSSYTSHPAKKEITIRQLLNHTTGIGYTFICKELDAIYIKAGIPEGIHKTDKTLKDQVLGLAKLPLLHEPGEKFTYGMNTDVLAYLVEVLSGKTFDLFLKERLFDPLGMEDTYFYLPEEKYDRMVTLYEDEKDYNLRKSSLADYYNYPIEGAKTHFSGGGGLSSTALDYARFMQMFMNGGKYNGHQILSRKSIELMTMNQVGDKRGNAGFGLGFGITMADKTKKLGSEGIYYWGGYFSTSYWLDPSEDLVAVFMTQMHPIEHEEIMDKFQVLTYQAIVD